MKSWLTLQEYSIEKGLSISTLRRKIKNRELEHKLENGRYLLKVKPQQHENIFSYEQNFQKKDEELKKLKNNNEDLLHLVQLLEADKEELLKQNTELLQYLEQQSAEI